MAINRVRLTAVAVKVESPSGVDAAPSLGTDAVVNVGGLPLLTIKTVEDGKRPSPGIGRLGVAGRSAPMGRTGSTTITVLARGKGSAYSGAGFDYVEADALLRAAGCGRTVLSIPAGVRYYDLDSGFETATVYGYGIDGNLYKLVGCVAKLKIGLQVGQYMLLTFEVEGKLTSVAAASISGLALNQIDAPVWGGNGSCAIGTWDLATAAPNQLMPRKLELDLGTQTTERPWPGADGHQGFTIIDRVPRASVEVEAVSLATFDPFAKAMAAAAALGNTKISAKVNGGAGNTIEVRTGTCQLEQPSQLDLGGLAGWRLEGDILAGTEPSVGTGTAFILDVT